MLWLWNLKGNVYQNLLNFYSYANHLFYLYCFKIAMYYCLHSKCLENTCNFSLCCGSEIIYFVSGYDPDLEQARKVFYCVFIVHILQSKKLPKICSVHCFKKSDPRQLYWLGSPKIMDPAGSGSETLVWNWRLVLWQSTRTGSGSTPRRTRSSATSPPTRWSMRKETQRWVHLF